MKDDPLSVDAYREMGSRGQAYDSAIFVDLRHHKGASIHWKWRNRSAVSEILFRRFDEYQQIRVRDAKRRGWLLDRAREAGNQSGIAYLKSGQAKPRDNYETGIEEYPDFVTGFVDASQAGGDDFQKQLAEMYAAPPCDVAKYDDLSPGQKALIKPEIYTNPTNDGHGLSQLERAVFVNITGALEKAGVNLTGLKLQQFGVQTDRLFFEPGSSGNFEKSIRGSTAFSEVDWFEYLGGDHPGMSTYMARQTVKTNSVQVGFGKKGAFADIDLFNLQGNLTKHKGEVDYNSGPPKRVTPHF